jgi:hypothetical protein
MPLVGIPFSLSGCAEGLTGATPGPDGSVGWPPSELEGVGPSPDPGEEVAVLVCEEGIRSDVGDGSRVDGAIREYSLVAQLLEPCRTERVSVVVVRQRSGHQVVTMASEAKE